MKIVTVCGLGVGSSLMLEINIKKILKDLGVEGEVSHTNLEDVKEIEADIFVMSKTLEDKVSVPCKIVLSNIIGTEEIKEKLTVELKRREII